MRIIIILLFTIQFCNSQDSRTWTSMQGSTIEAKLEKLDGNNVTLVTTAGRVINLSMDALSVADQEFLKQQIIENAGTEIPGISAEPGKISASIKCESSDWTYHVYLPKQFHMARKWPVGFIMSAGGGKDGKLLKRYIKGAEQFGVILVGSVESKNRFKQSQAAVEAMANDVYNRFPVIENGAFASGMSGGSRMSFLLSEQNKNVVGVLACGSGHGVYPDNEEPRKSNLRSNTYVYSLVGTNCFNRTGAFESHEGFNEQCRLRYFPGNHDWAGDSLILEGMARVVGQIYKENKDLAPYRSEYLKSLENLVGQLESEAPWESHYLASFGASFERDPTAENLAKKASELQQNPKVSLAQQAEEDIKKLCSSFYEEYDYFNGDTKDLPKRSKKAQELASNYTEIPHAEILKLLGQKSKASK